MFPLFLTILFLVVFTLFGTSEVKRFTRESFEAKLLEKIYAREGARDFERAEALFNDIKTIGGTAKPPPPNPGEEDKEPDSTPSSFPTYEKKSASYSRALKFDLKRPPNNSRLNFYLLLFQDPTRELYEIGARLIRQLYSETDFYTAGLEYHLLDELIKKREEMEVFKTPDELATVILEGGLKDDFYKMLKGDGAPSLLCYITFDPKQGHLNKKINFAFASRELLAAVITNAALLEEILVQRDEVWKQIHYEEKHRKSITKEEALTRGEISKLFKSYFDREDLADYRTLFDFTLNHPGTVLFMTDHETGVTSREKVGLFNS